MDITLIGNQEKTLIVSTDTVSIEKAGGVFTEKRVKSIPIRQITSVEVKKPGAMVGFIQFSIAGSTSPNSSYTLTGGVADAVKDENAVVFTGDDKYETALSIKAYVEGWGGSKQQTTPALSLADEILKLKALLDAGALSKDEFEQAKGKILSGI